MTALFDLPHSPKQHRGETWRPRDWQFGNLEPFAYDIIVADPNWKIEMRSGKGYKKSAQNHYRCNSTEVLKSWRVYELARKPTNLFLWGTAPMLARGDVHETMRAWGFEPKTFASWAKRTQSGKLSFGTGYIIRSSSEPILIGTLGGSIRMPKMRSHVDGVIGEHSEKPEEFYEQLAAATPGLRRCDLFSAGRVRPGFEGWGEPHADPTGE